MWRFGKNGADATAAAVRLAVAWKERTDQYAGIMRCGYHGFHDWAIQDANPAGTFGNNDYQWVSSFEYGELPNTMFERDLAAVIMEPILSSDPTWPDDGYLQAIRNYCDEHGALLIFDEVFTGFRLFPGGAHQLFGVEPDLVCFSKAMGNGMPISAVGGRREVMQLLDEGVFYSTTFAGETLSIAAALATIRKVRDERVHDHLRLMGDDLMLGVAEMAERFGLDLTVTPYAQHHWLRWGNEEQGRRFQQAALDRGVLIAYPTYHNLSYAMTESVIDEVLNRYEDAAKEVA
jgi:glutamate-1-semialdehyde aminotransferase